MLCTEAIDEIPSHIEFLLSRARRLTRDEADASDVVQETCLRALEALRQSELAPANLRGWLVVILRNQWFSALRQQRVRVHVHAELAAPEPVALPLHETRLQCRQLARAWSELPAHSRDIAHQCLIDGESQEEVSRRLGMTAGGVAASIHRTRQALRDSMSERAA
jgi:RNA polymerase sigma-70 factor (ECF subfamily)